MGETKEKKDPKPFDRWTLADPATVSYGPLGPEQPQPTDTDTDTDTTPNESDERFYLTTAINYANGPAHMGHAYEAATSDVVVRYQRLLKTTPKVRFCTGADEHGQKIAQTATDAGQEPQETVDHFVTGFRVLNQRILVGPDDYVRTTSERHRQAAHSLWNILLANGDLYLDTYKGWYNVREETFVTDAEAEAAEYKDPASGKPLKQVEEASYFFRMSQYQDQLLEHIQNANPDFIQPNMHKNQIVARLQQEKLRDLSVTRTTFAWGIPVPNDPTNKHVMYVWLDALTNYLTSVNYFGTDDEANNRKDKTATRDLKRFWPANVHVIGKDILWFHTVIWPCLLLAAGIPLPQKVFAHGFVNDGDGKKMSKSLGNVIDPHDMLDRYPIDSFRWYLCKEAPYGGELSFSEDSLMDMHNADLCDTLGNLVHRATNLCHKYCAGQVPDVPLSAATFPIDLPAILDQYCKSMDALDLQGGANVAMAALRDVNGYLQTEAPWLKKGDAHAQSRQATVRTCLECLYLIAHLLLPFMPQRLPLVFDKLGTPPVAQLEFLRSATADQPLLAIGTTITVGDVLYSKLLSAAEQDAADAAQAAGNRKKKESFAEAQARKKAEKAKQIASSMGGKDGNTAVHATDFAKMDIRVGKIVDVWHHPEADKLFCEKIDVGEDAPREIASGLRAHYTQEQLRDKLVLVVCNLKPSKMLGFVSQGMVLAATNAETGSVELVAPPADAVLGERVGLDGTLDAVAPVTAAQVKKRKVWESVGKELVTGDDQGVALYRNQTITTAAGPCRAPSMPAGARIG